MHLKTTLFGVVVLSLLVSMNGAPQEPARSPHSKFKCEVTKPNGIAAGTDEPAPGSYGNREVSVGPFGLCPDGILTFRPGGAGFVTQGGALGMKWGWIRGVPGKLKIEGRRLDGEAPPLRSEVPDGYGDLGFQATYLIFPTPGCWEVTGRVGEASVSFVTKVEKIGDGPPWRRTDLP